MPTATSTVTVTPGLPNVDLEIVQFTGAVLQAQPYVVQESAPSANAATPTPVAGCLVQTNPQCFWIDYTVQVRNVGAATLTNITLTNSKEVGSTFPSQGWIDPNASSTVVQWIPAASNNPAIATLAIGQLLSGQSTTVEFFVLTMPLNPGSAFVDTVSVGDDGTHGPDVNLANNAQTSTLTIPGTVSATPIPAVTGTPTPVATSVVLPFKIYLPIIPAAVQSGW